jgi:hypothetical protein
MIEFNIYLMFKLYKLFFKITSDKENSFVPSQKIKFHDKTYLNCIILILYIYY